MSKEEVMTETEEYFADFPIIKMEKGDYVEKQIKFSLKSDFSLRTH